MGQAFRQALAATGGGRIEPRHVQALAQAVYADGRLDADEIGQLIHLHRNGAAEGAPEAWADFFVEALADFFCLQRETPDWGADYSLTRGQAVSAAMSNMKRLAEGVFGGETAERTFAWSHVKAPCADGAAQDLSDAFKAEGGFVLDAIERRALARILQFAVEAPRPLIDLARRALIETVLRDGSIDAGEVEFARAIIYGPGGADNHAVSREEAEALFAIQTAARAGDNAPSWRDFFVKAITKHVLYGGGTPEVVDGDEALWLAAKLADGLDGDRRALLANLRVEAARIDQGLSNLIAAA